MKLLKISILFLLIFYSGADAQPDPDSLEQIINKLQGTEKVGKINQIARQYLDQDLSTALQLSDESFHLADQIHDQDGKAGAASLLGIINYLQGHFNQSEYYCNIGRGIAYARHNVKLEREINTTLALVYEEQGKYKESLELFTRNFVIDSGFHDTINLAIDFQNIAVTNEKLNNSDSALASFLSASALYEKERDSVRMAKVYDNVAKLYIRKNLDSARYFFNQSLNVYHSIGGIEGYYDIFWDLSGYLLKRNRPDSSVKILELGRRKAKEENNMGMLMKSYQLLSDTYEGTAQYAEAFRYQKEFTSIKDSLDTLFIREQVGDHIQRLENENKEQALELLRKEAQIRDKQWLNEDVIYFITFGGLFLILFIFLAFFARYRLYKKSITVTDKLKEELDSLSAEMIKKDEEISETNKMLEGVSRKNRILSAIINQPGNKDSWTEVIQSELKNIISDTEGHRAGVFLYNEYQQFLSLGELDNKRNELKRGVTLLPRKFPSFSEAVRTRPYLMAEDCAKSSDYSEFTASRFGKDQKTARIDFPIKIEQKLLGLLYVEKDEAEPGWPDDQLGKIGERSDKFIPLLVRAIREKSKEPENNKPDIISIRNIFRNFRILLLEKNEEGIVFQAFPDSLQVSGMPLEIPVGKNWMDSVDPNDLESVSAFYTSVGDSLEGTPFMLYNIADTTGRSVSVREEISAVIYINAERRLKSLVYLDYKGQTGANFNRSLTDDLPEMEEITVGELAYAEKEQGKSNRSGDVTYLRHNKWFIVYLIRFYRQLAINIGEELPLFRLNDLESRLFNSFEEPDILSLNHELEKIIDTIKPQFRESSEKEAVEAVSGIFRFNAPGMFVIEYAIDFLLDKLTTLGEKKIIFHKEWQYNKPMECDIALLTFIIYQVTVNGIGSIKREGDIYIRTAARNNKLNIIITDTGEGIPQEIKKTLLTSSVNVSAENKGFGLYFTKMILDLMGGMIKVRSQLNRGTEVLIEIPVGKK